MSGHYPGAYGSQTPPDNMHQGMYPHKFLVFLLLLFPINNIHLV